MKEFITVCPRNCYSTCSFRVFTEGGKVRRILPYADNQATPEGPCIKGLSYLEREFSPSRLLYPLKRMDDGTFTRISQDEALEIISEKLLDARARYGPHSVLFYKGSGSSGLSNEISGHFWKRFGGATTTYGNLCWPAGLEAVRLTLGEIKHNVPWDIANAQLVIIWGKNPAETNVQEMIHIDRAGKNRAKVVVIDPRRTPTADKADILLCPKPGTDAALALAMAKVIIDMRLTNESFIKKHVDGYEKFAASLNITPEDAEKITGIPAAAITEIAIMAGKTERVTIVPGYGLQRYTNGGQTIRSILSIAVITGKIGLPGCSFSFANLQGYVFDKTLEPLSYYPDKEHDKPFRRALSMAAFGKDFISMKDPAIAVAWIERGNPVTQLPDSNDVIRALKTIPFRVVVDQFMTDTAAMADIVLPAKGMFEQADVISSYWSPYVQYKPAVIDSPGEVMPESEIYFRLAGKMGMDVSGEDGIPAPDDYDRWLEDRVRKTDGFSVSRLKEGPLIPGGLEEIAYSNRKFSTASGKIELWSGSAAALWGVNPLPSFDPPDNFNEDDLPFRLMTPCIASRIHSQFGNLEVIRSLTDAPAWEMSVADARKLGLRSGDPIRVFNSGGEVRGRVRVTARVRSGSIVYPNGIWLTEGGGVNALVKPAATDMGHGAAFHNTRVGVEKAS